jgi:hypothetical protein
MILINIDKKLQVLGKILFIMNSFNLIKKDKIK